MTKAKTILLFVCIFALMLPAISHAESVPVESVLPYFISDYFELNQQPIPDTEQYLSNIQHPQLQQIVEGVTFTLDEVLYDGRTLFAVFTARSDVPLLHEFSGMAEQGSKYISVVSVDGDTATGFHAEKLNTDGSMTLYLSQTYITHKDEREFTLRLKVRPDGSDQLFGENITFLLQSDMQWTDALSADSIAFARSTLTVHASSCPLDNCIEVILQFPEELTEEEVIGYSESVIKIYNAVNGEELPSLNISGQLTDAHGNHCSVAMPSGNLTSLFSLPLNYVIPQSLLIEVVQVFGDGSVIESHIISDNMVTP